MRADGTVKLRNVGIGDLGCALAAKGGDDVIAKQLGVKGDGARLALGTDLLGHVALNQRAHRCRGAGAVAHASRVVAEPRAMVERLGRLSRLAVGQGVDAPERQAPSGGAAAAAGSVLEDPGADAVGRNPDAKTGRRRIALDVGALARPEALSGGLGELHCCLTPGRRFARVGTMSA